MSSQAEGSETIHHRVQEASGILDRERHDEHVAVSGACGQGRGAGSLLGKLPSKGGGDVALHWRDSGKSTGRTRVGGCSCWRRHLAEPTALLALGSAVAPSRPCPVTDQRCHSFSTTRPKLPRLQSALN